MLVIWPSPPQTHLWQVLVPGGMFGSIASGAISLRPYCFTFDVLSPNLAEAGLATQPLGWHGASCS